MSAALQTQRTLNGRRKAATLLVALGPERASAILGHLGEQEIEDVSLEMAQLKNIRPEDTENVFGELVETAMAASYLAHGGVDFAREVLERSLGADKADEIIGRLSAAIEQRPFEFLRRTPAEQITAFLRNESPQTIALVISHLNPPLAAQVLVDLADVEQAEVAARIATMGETSPEVVREVESVMKQRFSSIASAEYSAVGGVKALAEILNQVDRTTERNVLGSLDKEDTELAEEVRTLLFTFEDIVRLDDRSIQLVLREVDQKDLALALRGVSGEVSERVLANMSQRGAEMLREEMQFQPPQRKRVVEEAQGRIVAIIRRLEEQGVIVLGRGAEDEVV